MTSISIKRSVWSNPIFFIAFGFGAGLFRFFPGTLGTLMAIPFYLILQHFPWQIYLSVILTTFVAGIWICQETENAIGIPDYSGIVWDEMVGFWITMFLSPPDWRWIFLGFVLFRLFDIIKPWPISWFNKNVHKGAGIMLDDVIAALFAFVILQISLWAVSLSTY